MHAPQGRIDQIMSVKRNGIAANSAPVGFEPDSKGNRRGQRPEGRLGGVMLVKNAGLHVAIVGCGYWGSKHVRVLSATAGVDKITLVEQNAAIGHAMHSAFPATRVCTSLDEVLPHVDAVVVATPPQTHAVLAMKALSAGKHVLVEKPLAASTEEAQMLVDQARRSGTILMVAHTFQYNPAVRELRRRLRAGEFGQIYYIHSARLNLGLYRPDVNVVWDLAPHDISILNFLLDATPKAVDAWGGSLAFGGVEDMAYIRLEYENPQVTGYAHLSWLDPRKTRTVTVVGSEKMAVYDDMADEPLRIFDRGVMGCEGPSPSHERPVQYRYGDIVSPHIRLEEPLALQDRHFIDCIRNNTAPDTSGEQALGIMATLEAIDRSIRPRGLMPVVVPRARSRGMDSHHQAEERPMRSMKEELRS
jgi:predicted dehydrogenase